jgi:CRISPR-associated endonuclease Cas1
MEGLAPMAATATVAQDPSICQSPQTIAPRSGVITLCGYGIKIQVERGHLTIEDGVGSDRRRFRFPRVGHGLERLVVIGNDGLISLSALRWLADQNAAFVMLERDGSVLATSGCVRPSNARLRRNQALAHENGTALETAREIISRKLDGQMRVARKDLRNEEVARRIGNYRNSVLQSQTIADISVYESLAAADYWDSWKSLPVTFPKSDCNKVPEHWLTFGSRTSLLTRSPRLAVNPINAVLNYLYAILEAESALAASAVGLDPGLGFIHVDSRSRQSLACDLMEVGRPEVDSYVLRWFLTQPVRKDWFFEERNGNCRLMSSLACQLSDTSLLWARSVAPTAEWIAQKLNTARSGSREPMKIATRLTQTNRRVSRGVVAAPPALKIPQQQRICTGCGSPIDRRCDSCAKCATADSRERLLRVSVAGREASKTVTAQARRSATRRRHSLEQSAWDEQFARMAECGELQIKGAAKAGESHQCSHGSNNGCVSGLCG